MTRKLLQAALVATTMLTMTIACRREEKEDTFSPAYHIRQSEALTVPAVIDLPANLPNGNTRVATHYAEGVQKYKAQVKAGSSPAVYEWVLTGPEADLYDAANNKAGTHGAGPHWTLSAADSVFGQAYNPAKAAASPDAGSVDWLLLKPKAGTTPSGLFKDVAYIQRMATKGGKAPAIQPTSINQTVDIKYTAVYRFSKINP